MKKKKLSKSQKKEMHLRKARQWVTTYKGAPTKMVKHYRERFHVDVSTAARDLQEIGVEFTQEYLDKIQKAKQERIAKKQLKKAEKELKRLLDLYPDSDGTFCYIAGYTDGGVPYGITWDELGLEPYASDDDILEAYGNI